MCYYLNVVVPEYNVTDTFSAVFNVLRLQFTFDSNYTMAPRDNGYVIEMAVRYLTMI